MSPFQLPTDGGSADFYTPSPRPASIDSASLTKIQPYQNQINDTSFPSASPSNTPVLGNGPQDIKLLALDILSSRRVSAGSFCQDLRGRIHLCEINVIEEGNRGSKPLLSSISEVEVTPGELNKAVKFEHIMENI